MTDPQRWFDTWQRQRIWITSGGHCESCSAPLHYWTFHCDHIWPWSRGGRTVLSNSQALCPSCNLNKSNVTDITPFFKKATPRKWQAEFLEAFIDKAPRMALNSEEGFLLYATPGAGKTIAMFSAATYLKSNQLIRWVVIVVPSGPLKKQVAVEAKRLFGLELRWDDEGADSDFDGEVVTIQSLRNRDDRAIRRRYGEVLVCVDEFHHPSATNTWGEDLERTMGGCKYKLFATGTPFRSDRDTLKYVSYDDLGDGEIKLNPDYTYEYRDALRDSIGKPSHERIVRTAQFHLFDATDAEPIEWAIDGERYAHKLSDNLALAYEPEQQTGLSPFVKSLRSARYAAAIDIRFNLAKRMIRQAVDDLYKDIRKTHGHAAGLIVCKTKNHANSVASFMKDDLNIEPLVIYTDAEGGTTNSKIKAFKEVTSRHDWIVAVQQVSEGVDIKRIRSIVWLTNKKTHLLFLQILGRAIRWEHTLVGDTIVTPLTDQMAHMYLPAEGSDTIDKDDPIELVKFAKEIEADQELVIETRQRDACNVCGDQPANFGCGNCLSSAACPMFRQGGNNGHQAQDRVLLGAGGQEEGMLLRGLEYDPDQLRELQIRARQANVPIDQYLATLRTLSVEQFEKDKAIAAKTMMKRAERVAESVGVAVAEVEEMTKSEQMKVLKKDITRKVGQLGMGIARARNWADDDPRRQNIYPLIHKRWVKVGGKRTEETTVADLIAKSRWLDGELVKLTANNIDEGLISD